EAQYRRGGAAFVQADEHPAVGQHPVRMRVGIPGGRLAEAEPFVELHRRAHVVDGDADFVEGAEQRQRCRRHQAEAPRAAARLPAPLWVHAWQRWVMSSLSARAWLARALSAGTYS